MLAKRVNFFAKSFVINLLKILRNIESWICWILFFIINIMDNIVIMLAFAFDIVE